MSRPARTMGEVEIEKKKIVNVAMEILYEDGFDHLSMKKLGDRLGMTAANLYNYFSSKEELYIEMRRYGFLELYERLDAAYKKGQNLEERIKNLIREYVRFGVEEVFAYEILFIKKASYEQYKKTPLEAIANREMESSLRIFHLIMRCIREFADEGNRLPADEPTTAMLVYSYLHGVICLHNNNKMWFATDDSSKVIESAINSLYLLIFNVLQNPALADIEIE